MTKVLNNLYVTGTGSNSQALGVTGGYTYVANNLSVGEEIYSSNDNIYVKNQPQNYGIRVHGQDGNIFVISGSQTTYFNDFQTSSNLDSVIIGGTDSSNSFGVLKVGNSEHFVRIIGATSHSAIVSKGVIGFGETYSSDLNLYPLTFEGDLTNDRTRILFNLKELSFGTQSDPYILNLNKDGGVSVGTSSTNGRLYVQSTSTFSDDSILYLQNRIIGITSSSSLKVNTEGNILITNYNPQSSIEMSSTHSGKYSDLVLLTTNQNLSPNTFSKNTIIGLTNGIQISPRNNSIKLDPNVRIDSTIDNSIYFDFGFSTQSSQEFIGVLTQSSSNSKVLISAESNVSTSSNTQFGLNLRTNITSIGETQSISSLRIDSNITSTYSGSYAADLDIYSNGTPTLIVHNTGNISIGTTSNTAKLFISGGTSSFRLNDGNQGSGKFLISDANGYGNWTTYSSTGNATAFGTPSFIAVFNGISTLTASSIYQATHSNTILIGYTSSFSNYDFDTNTLRVKGDVFFDNFVFPLSTKIFYLNGSYVFDEVNGNLALGYTALGGNVNSGQYNIGIGHKSLLNATTNVDGNVAIGYESLRDNIAKYNIGIGYHALWKNTLATQSIAIGWKSLENGMTNSFNNIGIGFESLLNTLSPTNIAIGNNSLRGNVQGSQSIAIGFNSLSNGNSNNNIGIGHNSLVNSSTSDNIVIGNNSLNNLTTGSNSIAIGNSTLLSATSADNNIAIGNFSLRSNTIGSGNISIGLDSQRLGTSSVNNLSIGWLSLYNNRSPIGNNVALGNYSSYLQTTGYYNVAVGFSSLYNNTTGFGNVAIGWNSLGGGTISTYNVAIGYQSSYNTTFGGVYNLSIGYNSLFTNATGSYNFAIGGQSLFDSRGSRNIAIGHDSLRGLTWGFDNIAIGHNVYGFGLGRGNLIISGSNSATLGFDGNATISNNTLLGINILPASQSSNNTIIGGNQDLRQYLVNTASTVTAIPFANGSSPGGAGGALGNPLTGMVMISSGDGKRHFVSENDSVSIGVDAGLNDTWQLGKNIAIGRESMLNMNSVWRNLSVTASLGQSNIAIGYKALQVSTASQFNIAIGDLALQNQRFSGSATPQEYNIAIGYAALRFNTIGRQNVAIGFAANTTGNSSTTLGNIAIGYGALQLNNPLATSQNTAIGYQALNQNVTGIQNFAIGYNSSFGGTQGSFNVTIGNSSNMYSNGSSNIFIGHESGNPVGNVQLQTDSTNFLSNYNQNIGIGQWTHRYMGLYDSRWAGITPSSDNLAIGYRAFEGTTGSFWFGATYTVSSSYNVAIGNFALQNNQGTTYSTIGWSKGDGVLTSYALFGERTRAKGFNTSIGYASMQNNVTGFRNTAIGGEALSFGSHSTNNVAIGFRAGYNLGALRDFDPINLFGSVANNTSQANFNVAIGNFALHTATAASRSIAIGHSALEDYTGQDGHNVAIGWRSLQNLTTGINNTAVGSNAGNALATANNNIAIGLNTLNAGNPGSSNIAIGVQSQASNNGGANNITLGNNSGYFLRSSGNVAIGFESLYQVGTTIVSGSENVAIGQYAFGATNSSFNVAIGAQSQYYMGVPQIPTIAGTNNPDFGTTSQVPLFRNPIENLSIGYQSMRMFATVSSQALLPGLTQIFYPAYQVGVGNYTLQFNQGSQSVAVGYQAMANAANSSNNVAIGFQSMQLGSYSLNNIAIGFRAAYNLGSSATRLSGTLSTGYAASNIAIGSSALLTSTFSEDNISIGGSSLLRNTFGSRNIAIGTGALQENTIGVDNISIGYFALRNNVSTVASEAAFNVAIGRSALQANTTGYRNYALGYFALANNRTGQLNVAIGHNTMILSLSHSNTAIGYQSLNALQLGFNNVAIGAQAGSSLGGGTSSSVVGTQLDAFNTLIGSNAAAGLSAGSYNTIVGGLIGSANPIGMTFGDYNTYIGFGITTSVDSNFNNTVIGSRVNVLNGVTNSIIIANGLGQQRIQVNATGSVIIPSLAATASPRVLYTLSNGELSNTQRTNVRLLESFSGTSFSDKLIDAGRNASGGTIVDCTGYSGTQTLDNTVYINNSIKLVFGPINLVFGSTNSRSHMFWINSDGVSIEGQSRSTRASQLLSTATTFRMTTTGATQAGYHIYNGLTFSGTGASFSYNVINLKGFDCIGTASVYGSIGTGGTVSYTSYGVGGICIVEGDTFGSGGGINVNQVVIEDILVDGTRDHGILILGAILAQVRNTRVSSAGGHGFYIGGGAEGAPAGLNAGSSTSTILLNCYASSGNLAGFCLDGAAYCQLQNCASEYFGMGYFFRSCFNVSVFGCGAESNQSKSSIPKNLGVVFTNSTGVQTILDDIGSDFATRFRGTSYFISGGRNIYMPNPYSKDPGNVENQSGAPNQFTSHITVLGSARAVYIPNPRTTGTSPTSYAIRIEQSGTDRPRDVNILYNPQDDRPTYPSFPSYDLIPSIAFTRITSTGPQAVILDQGINSEIKNGTTWYSGGSTAFGGLLIGTATSLGHTSSILQLDSKTKGFLPPRMTTAEVLAISSPVDGLMVYNTDQQTLNFYSGTTATWSKVSYTSI